MRRARPVPDVPTGVVVLLVACLALQIAMHAIRPARETVIAALPAPPNANVFAALGLGEPRVAARFAMLWLQNFDYQPGVSVPFAALDYARLTAWLDTILALDPESAYPLLAASRVYAEVNDPPRQRMMLAFIERAFEQRPNTRWRWLAHAVFVARHRLQDDELALHYANLLAEQTDPAQVPSWARQMRIFVLEDIGELEAARVMLGALLAEGRITDPHEERFLAERLRAIEARIGDAPR